MRGVIGMRGQSATKHGQSSLSFRQSVRALAAAQARNWSVESSRSNKNNGGVIRTFWHAVAKMCYEMIEEVRTTTKEFLLKVGSRKGSPFFFLSA